MNQPHTSRQEDGPLKGTLFTHIWRMDTSFLYEYKSVAFCVHQLEVEIGRYACRPMEENFATHIIQESIGRTFWLL